MTSKRIVHALGVAVSLVLISSLGGDVRVKAAERQLPSGLQLLNPEARPPNLTAAQRDAALRNALPKIGSTMLYQKLAEHLGIKGMGPRNFARQPRTNLDNPPMVNELDHPVSFDSLSIFGQQTEPSIAVNPVNPNVVVVGGHNTNNFSGVSNACSIYVSLDGGDSFFYAYDTPVNTGFLANPAFCSDTVVRFSPDGSTLYMTSLEIDATTFDDIVWTAADFNGFAPDGWDFARGFIAFAPNLHDKQWIDVHAFDTTGAGAGFVYLSWTFFNNSFANCDILFQRYDNFLSGFGPGGLMAHSGTCDQPPLSARVLQGSRPAAGPQQQVLVCWYDAGVDGWSTGAQIVPPTPPNPEIPLNKFNIACRSSNDRGATFSGGTDPPETTPGNWIYAARGVPNEVAFYLGPMGPTSFSPFGYFRYSGAQFPSVTIDHTGNAHIAYTYNPSKRRFGSEQGNVGYGNAVQGTVLPLYAKWSGRKTVGTGFGAQFFPTVTAQHVWESSRPYIYVGYHDAARSRTLGKGNENLIYDTKYRRSTTGGGGFRPPEFVSDHASLTDYAFIGDYIDSNANAGIFQIVWADNRFATSIFQDNVHFMSDRF